MQTILAPISKPVFPIAMAVLPIGDGEEFPYFAWRCTWEQIENKKVEEAGSTYCWNRMGLKKFIGQMEKLVHEENPKLHYRAKTFEYVKVSKSLFDQLLTQSSGTIHVKNGFHPEDMEALEEFA